MSEKKSDLSNLKTQQEQQTEISPQHPPSNPHISYLMYIGGVIFLGLGIYFFFVNILREEPIVEVTIVNYNIQNANSNNQYIINVLTVDTAAITHRKNEQVVFVLKGNIAQEVPVSTGHIFGKFIEVKSGLSEGEKVILHPPPNLQSGSYVKVKQ